MFQVNAAPENDVFTLRFPEKVRLPNRQLPDELLYFCGYTGVVRGRDVILKLAAIVKSGDQTDAEVRIIARAGNRTQIDRNGQRRNTYPAASGELRTGVDPV